MPAAGAAKVAALPPVSILFAAFLGYNPMQSLLGPTLATLSPSRQAVLTGHSFFSNLIAGPFKHGLVIVFTFALIMCLIAALASWLRGAPVPEPAAAPAPATESATDSPPPDARAAEPDQDHHEAAAIASSHPPASDSGG